LTDFTVPNNFFNFVFVVDYVCHNIQDIYVEKILNFIAWQIERTIHLQFYLVWARKMIDAHTMNLKVRRSALQVSTALQKSLSIVDPIEGM